MKPVSGRRICQGLSRRGWGLLRITSSHHLYTRVGPPRQLLSIPVHGNKGLKAGTQRDIMRTAGLTGADP